MKFRVESQQHSEAIQKALFAGQALYTWHEGSPYKSTQMYFILHKGYYYVGDGIKGLFSSNSEAYFEASPRVVHSLVKGQIVEGDIQPWDGFIPWFGGECPVVLGETDRLEIIFRSGITAKGIIFNWDHSGSDYDIISYRVVKEETMENNYHDAYLSARENLATWEKRALEAERLCRVYAQAWNEQISLTPNDIIIIQKGTNRNIHADIIHEWSETGRAVVGRPIWRTEIPDGAKPLPFIACDSPTNPNWEYEWADEQPKPDAVQRVMIANYYGNVCIFGSSYDEHPNPNCELTFDAEGKLKSAEMI